MSDTGPDTGQDITIRPARDNDADGLIALVGACFEQYPGCVVDLDHFDRDLRAFATSVGEAGGAAWVAERSGAIVGLVGYGVRAGPVVELLRLYVSPAARRLGLATKLLGLVSVAAKDMDAGAITLWSDTRFQEAHAFYLAHGYRQLPKTRTLNDPSNSTEYQFRREVIS